MNHDLTESVAHMQQEGGLLAALGAGILTSDMIAIPLYERERQLRTADITDAELLKHEPAELLKFAPVPTYDIGVAVNGDFLVLTVTEHDPATGEVKLPIREARLWLQTVEEGVT